MSDPIVRYGDGAIPLPVPIAPPEFAARRARLLERVHAAAAHGVVL